MKIIKIILFCCLAAVLGCKGESSNLPIGSGTLAALTVKVTSGGEILYAYTQDEPYMYSDDDETLLPQVKEQLAGKKAGDEISFSVTSAFGECREDLIQTLSVSRLNNTITPQKGLLMTANSDSGEKLTGIITGINGEEVIINFNHPLCAKDIDYTIGVISVEQVYDNPI